MHRLLIACVIVLVAGAFFSVFGPRPFLPGELNLSPSTPSVVRVEKQPDGSWHYLVNEKPTYMVGVGYNAIYRYLPDTERERRYRRDFAILREAGVNTITGWDADKGYDQDVFDDLTLDTAHEFGIGVIVPILMLPEKDYRDPTFVESLRQQAIAKVTAYKDHPALRMWGLGNEVLTEMPREQWAAFGRAYLMIADLVHEMDPNHPVIYREAENFFLPHIAQRVGPNRPWVLYGMNIYSNRIDELLKQWPDEGLDKPLFISEFGPNDRAPYGDRPDTFVEMWQTIRNYPQWVLGGAPYVWMAPGPEPVDSFYGLVDAETARPVDESWPRLVDEFKKVPR